LPLGLVFHLAHDGSSFRDLVNHTVSCPTTCPTLTPGIHGNGFDFSGNRALTVVHTADLDPTGGFTLSLWVRLSSVPGGAAYACFLGKAIGGGSLNTYGLCVESIGRAFYHSGTSTMVDNLTGAALSLATWHHLAMTWDGITKRGYLDGVADVSQPVPLVEDDMHLVSIGSDYNAGNPTYWTDGELDDVMIFNRALDPAEILQLAQP